MQYAPAAHTPLAVEYVEPRALHPAGYNPRTITAEAMERLCRSLREFGFVDPVVARRSDGLVIGGHQRLEAAQHLGFDRVPVVFIEVDDARAKALNVALNNPALAGTYDEAKLADLLRELQATDIDASLSGFDQGEVERILAEAEAAALQPLTDPDEAPSLPVAPKARPGDLWTLGRHRLLCGDAAKQADLQRVMAGELANCLWSDPPYGVNYQGGTADALTIENDSPDGLASLLEDAFEAADPVLAEGAAIYVAHPAGPLSKVFMDAFLAAGWQFRQGLVWVKDGLVLGHADYHYRHEPLLFGYRPGPGRRGRGGIGWFGDDSQTTVFEVPRPRRNAEHPTMKPVELIERMLRNSARAGDLVLDPFAGSGSTLIAAEKLGLRARAIEIDPRYADVVVQRWEAFTGRQAVLEEAPHGGA